MSDPTPPISYTFEVPGLSTGARRRRASADAALLAALLLLLLTLLTTLVVGARLQYNFVHDLPAFTTDNFSLPLFPSAGLATSGATG